MSHWTNTRLVCTHLNASFILNPIIAMNILIVEILVKKCWKNIASTSALDVGMKGVKNCDSSGGGDVNKLFHMTKGSYTMFSYQVEVLCLAHARVVDAFMSCWQPLNLLRL